MRDVHALQRAVGRRGHGSSGSFTRRARRRVGAQRRSASAARRPGLRRTGRRPRVFRFAAPSSRRGIRTCSRRASTAGPECVASHRTAAALHGFDGFDADVVEVARSDARASPAQERDRASHARLAGDDRARIGSIPVTSRARTLIDLGRSRPPISSKRRSTAPSATAPSGDDQVESRYAALRAPGRNGIGAMTQILDGRLGDRADSALGAGAPDASPPERRRAAACRSVGHPRSTFGRRRRTSSTSRTSIVARDRSRRARKPRDASQRAADNVRDERARRRRVDASARSPTSRSMHEPALVATTVEPRCGARVDVDRL